MAGIVEPTAGEPHTSDLGVMKIGGAVTLPERHLIAELAVGIARRLKFILGQSGEGRRDMGPDYVYHMHASAFTAGCRVLWELGVARAAYGPERGRSDLTWQSADEKHWPPYFRFFAPSEIRNLLSGDPPGSPGMARAERQAGRDFPTPALHDVLCAYLGVACDYGRGSCLSSRREPFIPEQEYVLEINALVHSGYLERHGTAVVWTDKIASAMQKSYFWEADGRSSHAVAEAALQYDLSTALVATPEHTKRLLAQEAKRLSEVDFAILLRDRFDGLYWRKYPDGTLRGDVSLVQAVRRFLRSHC